MANEVEILDAIMGSNKTNGIIKWMDNHPNEKYIYISPLLSEQLVSVLLIRLTPL